MANTKKEAPVEDTLINADVEEAYQEVMRRLTGE